MKNKKQYIISLILDIAIIALSFLFMVWLKPGSRTHYLPAYLRPFIGFSILWVFISILSGKYNHAKEKLLNTFKTCMLANFYITGIVLISIFVFKRLEYSRAIVIGTIILATLFEFIYIVLFTAYRKEKAYHVDIACNMSKKVRDMTVKKKREEVIVNFPILEDRSQSAEEMLKKRYLHKFPQIFSLITKSVNLGTIHKQQAKVINSQTFFNIENYEAQTQQLFVNLHKLNDIKRINKYMLKVNENLKYGGFYVGSCQTLQDEFDKIFVRFPKFIAVLIYGINFVFKRVIPKLPIFKQIYFIMTNGTGRYISKAEILGRLYYCGFRVEDIYEMDGRLHFVAKKVAKPSEDLTPSYGPIIKLKRIGHYGELLYVYKFRTMHPYSEYLQEYIYENYQLEDGGKFKNDFRITGWGKIFRKLWIDELPQFINVFRGQLGIVGVRALSEHYFGLYPAELQMLRTKFKPGLVPPYYVDMPVTFDEIVESERKYLEKRSKHPIFTQIEYFHKAWWNIIVRKARSN